MDPQKDKTPSSPLWGQTLWLSVLMRTTSQHPKVHGLDGGRALIVSPPRTVGSKTVPMFGGFELFAMQRLTAWEYRLALAGLGKVLLLGFLMVF